MSSDDVFKVDAWLKGRDAAADATRVKFTQPQQVAMWSKTSASEGSQILFNDDSGLAVFRSPALPTDLNEGYPDAFIRKDESQSSPVEPIIQAATQQGVEWHTVSVCTYRNNLNKITQTPLQPGDSWAVDACLWGSTLFLDIVKGPQADYPNADRFMYYGYKFEALCTGSAEVDATSEYAAVVRFQLGGLQVLMGAEVDCQGGDMDPQDPLGSYVELKTYTLPSHKEAEARLARDKYPKWWVQSFLAGVPTIVAGGRDKQGLLRQVWRLPVQQLPALAAAKGQATGAFTLLAFLEDALGWMRDVAAMNSEQHLRFTYDGSTRTVTYKVVPDGTLPSRMEKAHSQPESSP